MCKQGLAHSIASYILGTFYKTTFLFLKATVPLPLAPDNVCRAA